MIGGITFTRLGALLPSLVKASFLDAVLYTTLSMMVFWAIGTASHARGPQKFFPER